MVDERVSSRTAEEAVEKALLFTFQLSGKDYRKMQTALSEVAFIRALEQDGYTVAPLNAVAAREADLAAAVEAIEPDEWTLLTAGPYGSRFEVTCRARAAVLRLFRGEAGTK